MWNLLRQTRAERRAYRQGISLFFGALLGALLGTITNLPLRDYASLVLLLAVIVLLLQLVGAARSRIYAIGSLLTGMLLIGFGWWSDELRPAALAPEAFDRLAVTLALWLGIALLIELTPTVRSNDE